MCVDSSGQHMTPSSQWDIIIWTQKLDNDQMTIDGGGWVSAGAARCVGKFDIKPSFSVSLKLFFKKYFLKDLMPSLPPCLPSYPPPPPSPTLRICFLDMCFGEGVRYGSNFLALDNQYEDSVLSICNFMKSKLVSWWLVVHSKLFLLLKPSSPMQLTGCLSVFRSTCGHRPESLNLMTLWGR